jgi:Spy/CpxP family protein refolding chaperone
MMKQTMAGMLAALALAVTAPGAHAGSADALAPKALSAEEVEDLAAGHGMGLARAAELNHYPGPRHVLDLGDRLGLTPDQRSTAEALFAAVQRDAGSLGQEIIADERALDAMFASGGAELGAVDAMVARIADRRGRLRFVHLAAHVKMRALLTPHQIALYDSLRGNDADAAQGMHDHMP